MGNIFSSIETSAHSLELMWVAIAAASAGVVIFSLIDFEVNGDRDAGLGLVSSGIVFTGGFGFFLARTLVMEKDETEAANESSLGTFGGELIPVGFFLIACGLTVAGLVLMKVEVVQSFIIIMGIMVILDGTFNFARTMQKTNSCGKLRHHLKKKAGVDLNAGAGGHGDE